MQARSKAVAVYAFQNKGAADLEKTRDPDHLAAAILLGQELATRGITLVTGGMRDGLMGLVATAALQAGGHVIGVIPEHFPVEDRHPGIKDIRIVADGYERKRLMMRLSDASITMAGGRGTQAEYFNEDDIMKEISKGYASAEQYGVSPDRPVVVFDPSSGKFHGPIRALAENMGHVKGNTTDLDALNIVTNVRQALLESRVISQKEYDDIYSELAAQLDNPSREVIDDLVKPIAPKTRKRHFRLAGALMAGGLVSLMLTYAAPRMIPGAMDGPYSKAAAAIEASGKQIPYVSENDYRSLRYEDVERVHNRQPLPADAPQYERDIFKKMALVASMPRASEAELTSSDVCLATLLLGLGTLTAAGLVNNAARRRPSIVFPRLIT